jgi:hypothetical protein
MSQHPNHRRDGKRHQDNGPRWENPNPMAGCNATHVARARKKHRARSRRADRRTDEPDLEDALDELVEAEAFEYELAMRLDDFLEEGGAL